MKNIYLWLVLRAKVCSSSCPADTSSLPRHSCLAQGAEPSCLDQGMLKCTGRHWEKARPFS